MKNLEEKKEMIKNFEGFYIDRGTNLFEDPTKKPVISSTQFRFEKPEIISNDYNNVMGRCVQYIGPEIFRQLQCAGADIISSNNFFNTLIKLYVLKYDNKTETYEGKIADKDDSTQSTFNYDGNKNFLVSGFELNSDENKDKFAGNVLEGTLYKTVPNNPTQKDIETFLFNPENCETIGFVFNDAQLFLIRLLNLYQQGKIKEEIPAKWFSNTQKCNEQSLILLDNLLVFYVNVQPNYYQSYFKQEVDIDNILKLYN
jgi:hypothetical protein